jgi:hypothetical protein
MILYQSTTAEERIEFVRQSLFDSGSAAINLIQYMSLEERKELLCELVGLASSAHGLTRAAQELILSLPRDWLLAHIEPCVDRVLENATYEEYWAMLTLYRMLDESLMRKLAERAFQNDDPNVKDAGEHFLGELGKGEKEQGE